MSTPPPLPTPAPAVPLPPMPPPAQPNLLHAWGGVWRLTWPQVFAPSRWLGTGVLLAVFGLLSYLAASDGSPAKFLEWASGFYLQAMIPIGAFLTGAGAIRDDMKPIAVDYVLGRPVPRPALVLFRYAAQLICTQLLGLLTFAVLIGTAIARGVPDLGAVAPALLLAQAMGIAAFLALGFLCGALTSRYLVLGLVYGGLIEIGIGQIPIQLNRLSILHHLRVLLQEAAPATATAASSSAAGTASTLALLLVIAAALLAAAAACFTVREFTGAQPKDG